MDGRFGSILENISQLEENGGVNKVISLTEAIRRWVKPGMMVHVGECANAAVREILRQFWGTRPGFTLVAAATGGYALSLIYAGLVKKVVTSACSEIYPSTRASPLIQKAYKERAVEIENWSLHSLTQRYMAGALGVPFMPTRSVAGSSMAKENQDSFRKIADPFGSGKDISLVKALQPDISLIHGWAADRGGNTILAMAPISGEGAWGALASKNGVIVTVEQLVSTDFIREHSAQVKIPGYMVKSVSVTPFGSHPYGLADCGIKEFEAYGPDYEFMLDYQQAGKASEAMEVWTKKWVLSCSSHEDYLSKLGEERLAFLKLKADRDFWRKKLKSAANDVFVPPECTATERMIVAAAHQIGHKVLKEGYKLILAGIGAASLAATLAYYELKQRGYFAELIMGSGWYGYAPRPGDPWLFNPCNIATCKMIGEVTDAYGVWVGADNQCLSVLGAGQIDKHGNINSTRITPELFLIGSGGSNDAANAKEVIVIAPQSAKRFVEKVSYITCPGQNVKTLVSTKGIFEKLGCDNDFSLTGCFSTPNIRRDKEIEEIRKECGWQLKVSPNLSEIPAPDRDELLALRLLDPEGYFTKD